MKITVEADVSQVVEMFKGIEAGMLDLRQLGAWKAVASEFRKVEKEHFGVEGGGRSGKWKPLTAKYAKAKQRRWGTQPILQASGKMYRSLTQAGAPGAVVEEGKQELAIGTSIKYAGYHQTGGKHLPARPPIDLTEEQERRILEPLKLKLIQLAGNAKLRTLRGL